MLKAAVSVLLTNWTAAMATDPISCLQGGQGGCSSVSQEQRGVCRVQGTCG